MGVGEVVGSQVGQFFVKKKKKKKKKRAPNNSERKKEMVILTTNSLYKQKHASNLRSKLSGTKPSRLISSLPPTEGFFNRTGN